MTVSPARGARDVRFTIPTVQGGGTLSVMIARGVGNDGRKYRIRRAAVPYEENGRSRLRETSVTYANWTRGAGFGKADQSTVDGYNVGTNVYARSRGILMPAGEITEISLSAVPGGVVALGSAFDMGGFTYMTCQNTRMLKVTNAGTSVSADDAGVSLGAGAAATSSAVFGGKAWVASGASQRMVSFDGSTWAAATDDVRRSKLAVTNWTLGAQMANSASLIGTSQRVLVATDPTLSSIYHCVDDPGLTASYAGPNAVGDSAYPIASLHAAGEAVFAGKPDGVFMIQGGGKMPNLAPHWRNQYDAGNGSVLQFYDEFLFAGHTQFLDMLSPNPDRVGLQMPCHPGASESDGNRPLFIRCTAATIDSGHILASFWDGINSYVMAGRRADRVGFGDNRNPIVWYGAEALLTGYCTLLHIMPSVGTGPRWLMIGMYSSGVARLYAQSLPKQLTPYAAWKTSGNTHRFAPQWTLAQSLDDLGDAASPKNMRYVSVVTENASTARNLTVYTSMDGFDPAEQIVITESGHQTAVFDTATAAGVNVQVTMVGNSGPTEPLVMRSIKVRGTINDERTVVYEVPLEIGRDVVTNRATRDPSSPFVKRAQLYALLEAGPIQVLDWNGIERTMAVEDVSDTEILDDDGLGLTIVAVVTLSVLLALPKYGASGSVYGSSRYG